MDSLRQNALLQQEIEAEHEITFASKPLVVEHQHAAEPSLYLQLLWDRRQLLARVLAWSLVVSFVIAFVLPRRYESTVTLMPPDQVSGNSAMLAAVAGKVDPGMAGIASNLLGMKSNGAMFAALLSSRTVQDRIIERFRLQTVYSAHYMQDTRLILASRTDISEDRKSGIISLKVRDGDPKRARDIAQAYAEELNRVVAEVSTSAARRERMFIEQRMAGVHQDLEDAEKQFGAFASKNAALDIKEQTKAMVQSAAELQGRLIAAQSELQGLEQIYASANVRVRAARARIQELQQQLQKIGGSDSNGIITQDSKGDELYPSIRQLPLLGVEWAELYRRMKIQETIFELLNQQFELARIQEAKEIPSLNVIDPANFPERKSWPPRLLIILALSALSLAVTIAWLIGRARWERIDPKNRDKQLLETIIATLRSHLRSIAEHPQVTRLARLRGIFQRRSEQSE